MSPHLILGLVAVFAPLAVAALLLVVAPLRRQGKGAAGLSVLAALASFGSAAALLVDHLGGHAQPVLEQVTWLVASGRPIASVGVQLDGISVPMLAVVGLVALCVQVFSLAYMADEEDAAFGRYFTWQSLFLFSMQALVVAPNLLQLFVAWELVGLCSYLLIGFYYRKASAGAASLKAFWITKLADLGLLLGLIVQFVHAGSFGWSPDTVAALQASGAVTAVAGLYFVAVMGKSAQFPFHVWLPNAMEGPTPVSALLHAATMVAAGVFLIVRAYPVFQAAPDVMVAMAMVGGFTAVFAACLAIVQTDIKKVLAYSTCSQLGYMVAALGGGSLAGGYFHLTTHAFFKALLFLAAGSVIHAVHSNELADMGGLARRMRTTTVTFILGAAALAGLPLLSGFYSKDLILEGLLEAAHADPVFYLPLAACLFTVGLTAFYMARVVLQAFFGAPSEAASHAHEGGWAMRLPLLVLTTLTVGLGWAAGDMVHLYGVHDLHVGLFHVTPIGATGIGLALLGMAMAFLWRAPGSAAAFAPLGAFIRRGWVDAAWAHAYRGGLMVMAGGAAFIDRYVIDGALNAGAVLTLDASERARDLQTGRATDYVFAVALGIVVMAAVSQVWPMGVW